MVDQDSTASTTKRDTTPPKTRARVGTFLVATFRSMKTLIQTIAIIVVSGVTLIFLLGLSQRMGWISAGGHVAQPGAPGKSAPCLHCYGL